MNKAEPPKHPRNPSQDSSQTNERQNLDLTNNKESDLLILAQRLRQRNQVLQQQVTQLEEALRENEVKLRSQTDHYQQKDAIRAQEVNNILAQQAEEVNQANQHINRLFQELEASHQVAQRQQVLIETLTEEFQNSQERIAQLERDCALTQQRYDEQCHQLQLLQVQNQEIQTRLQRQQRQTLQFKMALEKSLEVKTPEDDSLTPAIPTTNSLKSQEPVPAVRWQTQPIQPWSTPEELVGPAAPELTAPSEPETGRSPLPLPGELPQVQPLPDIWDNPPETPENTVNTSQPLNEIKLRQLLEAVKRNPYQPPEDNSPAPIIYPERPLKKIPSLSAINLPNFPRFRPPEN